MTPIPPETAEILTRVRQQLILAQVRIMELEDARDSLASEVTDRTKLLSSAQTLADLKMEEAAHHVKLHTDLMVQYEHMRHMQHVTNEALKATREELAAASQIQQGQSQQISSMRDQIDDLSAALSRLKSELIDANKTSAERFARIAALENDADRLRKSRSWRWTGWLRAIERMLGLKP